MIVPYLPLFFVMIVMLAHPHDPCRHHTPQAVARCVTPVRADNRQAAVPLPSARPVPPNPDKPPQDQIAVLQPATPAPTDIRTRTIRQVAAATAVAEQLTAATAPPGSKTAPAATNLSFPLVALLVTRPDVKSAADLTGKTIAIDGISAAVKNRVQLAIASSGTSGVKLSGGKTKAIERLMQEKASAAVVAVVSPEAAEVFPEIDGFKVLRIPVP